MRLARTTLAVLAALAAATTPAAADPARATADAHARRGIALYNLGKYDDAIAAFEAAYTLVPSDALLFNLAQAHRQAEHCDRAVTYYQRYMAGAPAPALASQVAALLPTLVEACRSRFVPPTGAVTAASDPRSVDTAAPVPDVPAITAQASPPPAAVAWSITAGLTAGVVISGGTAPTTGAKLLVLAAPRRLRGGELGVALGAGRLWREEAQHAATTGLLAATARYAAGFERGRVTLGVELGAAYVSSLDSSSGVVPGIRRGGQWLPLGRLEVGAERDLARGFALRVGVAVAGSPRVGEMLTAVGQVDLLVAGRYTP